jgi:outer membrane protein
MLSDSRRKHGVSAAIWWPGAMSGIVTAMQVHSSGWRLRWLSTVSALALLFGPAAASADTLASALAEAYQNNPSLNGERARLRATDEELAKAQSGYRPNIDINADYGLQNLNSAIRPPKLANGKAPTPGQIAANEASFRRNDGQTHPGGFSVVLNQPLFEGFRTVNAVKAADARIMAERASLVDAEQKTLIDTIRTYMDVLRDSATVTLRQNSLQLLKNEARATAERFAAGEMTRTDVAQAKARESEALAALELSKAVLRNSLAEYERLVGHIPTRLTDPTGFERALPTRLEDAVRAAMGANPQVIQAAYMEAASQHDIRKILGEMLPDVRLQAQHNERFEPTPLINQQVSQSISARVNVPIYQSGEIEARVRQAKQEHQGRLQDIEAARARARSSAIGAFAQVQAQRAQLAAVRQEVKALGDSLAGVREEQKAGTRTLLDVLNAEQEEVNAKVQAVRARHDLVVASYILLQSMGRLTAADLGLNVALYDVEKHYNETNRKWSGLSIERESGDVSSAPTWGAMLDPAQ